MVRHILKDIGETYCGAPTLLEKTEKHGMDRGTPTDNAWAKQCSECKKLWRRALDKAGIVLTKI